MEDSQMAVSSLPADLPAASAPPPSMPRTKGRKRLVESEEEYEPEQENDSDSDYFDGSASKSKKKAARISSAGTPKASPSKKKKVPVELEDSPFHSPKKASRKIERVAFEDLPEWRDQHIPLFELPGEIADAILSQPGLGQRDHLSLAASCKTIRQVYTPAIWLAISRQRKVVDSDDWALQGAHVEQADEKLLAFMFTERPRTLARISPRCAAHEAVREAVHEERLSQTASRSKYKVTVQQITALKCQQIYNRKSPDHPIEMYLETAVEALAFRAHGGPLGHAARVQKCNDQAAKARETRIANGTQRTPSPKKAFRPYGGRDYGGYGGHRFRFGDYM